MLLKIIKICDSVDGHYYGNKNVGKITEFKLQGVTRVTRI